MEFFLDSIFLYLDQKNSVTGQFSRSVSVLLQFLIKEMHLLSLKLKIFPLPTRHKRSQFSNEYPARKEFPLLCNTNYIWLFSQNLFLLFRTHLSEFHIDFQNCLTFYLAWTDKYMDSSNFVRNASETSTQGIIRGLIHVISTLQQKFDFQCNMIFAVFLFYLNAF